MKLLFTEACFCPAGGIRRQDGSGFEKILPLPSIQRIPVHAEAVQGSGNGLLVDLRLSLQRGLVMGGRCCL